MRLSATFLLFGAVVLLITFVDCQELTSTLQTSDIYGVPVAYDGEYVTFTCVTRGSGTIAWSSEEQIGSGGRRLELISVQPIGTFVTAGTATATLISVSDNSGSVVIVSQLQISVSSTYQTSSVTCHSVGIDTQNTTLFYMADEVSLQCDNYCPGEAVTCTCTVASSSTLSWISEEYIGRGSSLQFTSNDTVPSTLNTTAPGTDARLTKNSNTNGVFVITSKISILSSSNNSIILTCRNVGRSDSRTAIISVNDDCASPLATSMSYLMTTSHSISDTDPTTETTIPNKNKNSQVSVVVAVTTGLLSMIVIVIVIVVIVIILCRNNPKPRKCDKCHTKLENMCHEDNMVEMEPLTITHTKEVAEEETLKIEPLTITHTKEVAEEETLKTAETHIRQKDTQLDQQTMRIQNLNTQVREKDERLREIVERLREIEERLREKDERLKEIEERLREKDERLKEIDERQRRREVEFQVEVKRLQSQVRNKDKDIHRKEDHISRLHIELLNQIMLVSLMRETPQSGAELTGRTRPEVKFESPIQFVPKHVPPLQTCSYGSQVSRFVAATQQFSRDQELMECSAGTIYLYAVQAEAFETNVKSHTQSQFKFPRQYVHMTPSVTLSFGLQVSPSVEGPQHLSNKQEITIADLRTENKTLTEKIRDFQGEINALKEEVRCLQTENKRLREKESVSETVVQEKYNKLNMIDDLIGVVMTDITSINHKTKEAHLVAQEKSDKIDILDVEVGQLIAEMLNEKQQNAQDGAGAMVYNVIKGHDEDKKCYKSFRKDKNY